jgi:catechol 2,3-dioxygenase-like lactoylglutathione lyase family enzyme
MRMEHTALNVADPTAMAAWYVRQLGMRVARAGGAPAHAHFLLDAAGTVLLEIYHSAAATVPDYASGHPLQFHIAFLADDPDAARDELVAAGATLVDDQRADDGSRFVMLRDPWGIPLQLCRRASPLLAPPDR